MAGYPSDDDAGYEADCVPEDELEPGPEDVSPALGPALFFIGVTLGLATACALLALLGLR